MLSLWLLAGCPWVDRDELLDRDRDGAVASAMGGTDCDDADAGIGPPSLTTYADADADGLGDPESAELTCTAGDRVLTGTDCDDADASVGAPSPWWPDDDGDGYGDLAAVSTVACAGGSANAEDCDDGSTEVHPGVAELCFNGVDDDCNGSIDDCTAGTAAITAGAIPALLGQVAIVGPDFDGDSLEDLVIGVPATSSVYGYSQNTLPAAPLTLDDADLTGVDFGSLAGTSLAYADVYGDGSSVLIVGARASGSETARLAFLTLPATGEHEPTWWFDAQAESQYSAFGTSLAVGDLEGDGNLEIVAGDPYEGHYCGGAYVVRTPLAEQRGNVGSIDDYYNETIGFGGVVRLTSACRDSGNATTSELLGSATTFVKADDGTSRIALAAPFSDLSADLDVSNGGHVLLVGGDLGKIGSIDVSDLSGRDDHGFIGVEGDAWFGANLVPGDFDGDGSEDLLVAAPYARGTVENGGVVYGFSAAVAKADAGWTYADRADFSLSGIQAGRLFGVGVTALDHDADGALDIAVGASDWATASGAGAVVLFTGPFTTGMRAADEADHAWFATTTGSAFGTLVTAGNLDDVPGDDLVVGAPTEGNGAIYLLR